MVAKSTPSTKPWAGGVTRARTGGVWSPTNVKMNSCRVTTYPASAIRRRTYSAEASYPGVPETRFPPAASAKSWNFSWCFRMSFVLTAFRKSFVSLMSSPEAGAASKASEVTTAGRSAETLAKARNIGTSGVRGFRQAVGPTYRV